MCSELVARVESLEKAENVPCMDDYGDHHSSMLTSQDLLLIDLLRWFVNSTIGDASRSKVVRVRATGFQEEEKEKKKVVVVGSGWAGLGAARHLCKQGFDVKVIEDNEGCGSGDDVCIQGFWHPYQNIFGLVDEIGIKPFKHWMKSAQYSEEGLEVEFPVYKDLPQLPSPLGPLVYTQFPRLALVDRLTLLPLMAAVIDFDNTDAAWRKYDAITARELFRMYGCSEKLYRGVLHPLLQVGLFAPPEQCSAAAALSLLNFLLTHQNDFDVVWCRGKVKDQIFQPWMDTMKSEGCEFLEGKGEINFLLDEEKGCITGVACGEEMYSADAFILAVSISSLQSIIRTSAALRTRDEFLRVLNLAGVDALSVKLAFDRKVALPNACNACSGFDDSFGWTFFDLNVLQDEHKAATTQIIQTDFYNASQLLLLRDDLLVSKFTTYLSNLVKGFESATVIEYEIRRYPRALSHFFPGSYNNMMRGSTSFPNLFMAGDWIINRHGSWSQEKSYVSGLEAANRVVDYLEEGSFAKIIPVEDAEQHIQALRGLNRSLNELVAQTPLAGFFLQ
ncbi:hypothetical protein MLD38_013640 [Melastoma candidum]|uniref:Uncharacterized protein n=1 Tax=Melastoma candidum TaxID=119954 RepID=A0ACB9RDC3_9MYRT|nr:hypothetical protein MLD38_013640 [Melastoma candidum]